ncbi:UNVERIFIED_CONTAM: hypothetical protein PYX00_006795 [Menopon gallinae]|uniref:Reverse transcriptase domain-containing protein n=1 Tax=Menopon gallinae TaxID=328185 RepID=A0AAW2HWN2_9NEOP
MVIDHRLEVGGKGSGLSHAWVIVDGLLIVSTYISPNIDYKAADEIITEIEATIAKHRGKKPILAGDFNAKIPAAGSTLLDRRGIAILEVASRHDLTLLNDGKTPTFRRGRQVSYPDITLVGDDIAKDTTWQVLDTESLSDHNYIDICIRSDHIGRLSRERGDSKNIWDVRNLSANNLKRKLCEIKEEGALDDPSPENLVRQSLRICEAAMPLLRPSAKTGAYWWNGTLRSMKKECIKARRTLTRMRARRSLDSGEVERAAQEYSIKKRALVREIKTAKSAKWKALCEAVENNPWGLAYKIVTKRIGLHPPKLAEELEKEIILELFPQEPRPSDRQKPKERCEPPSPFSKEELKKAVNEMGTRKAPGPDGIPGGVIKEIAENEPEIVLRSFNELLKRGEFPRIWKQARVYRPISLLDEWGKLYERLISGRLVEKLESGGRLADNQFGFRKGRGTVDALEVVIGTARRELVKSQGSRGTCVLTTLDVKNAFNCANWDTILDGLRRRDIPGYIVELISSYLSERIILHGSGDVAVTAGVPQGSVLGPILWNVLYDYVLRLKLPAGVQAIAYADDLALCAVARTPEEMEVKVNGAIIKILRWMEVNGLALAAEKTEAVCLSGRKRIRPLVLRVGGVQVPIKEEVKYLGVTFDKKMTFVPHVAEQLAKAHKLNGEPEETAPEIRRALRA